MDIADWRKKIDEVDQQLVRLINERAVCAVEIGKLKHGLAMPVYEPDRERIINTFPYYGAPYNKAEQAGLEPISTGFYDQ